MISGQAQSVLKWHLTQKLCMLELTLLLDGYRKSYVLVLMVMSNMTLGIWVKVKQLSHKKNIQKCPYLNNDAY